MNEGLIITLLIVNIALSAAALLVFLSPCMMSRVRGIITLFLNTERVAGGSLFVLG